MYVWENLWTVSTVFDQRLLSLPTELVFQGQFGLRRVNGTVRSGVTNDDLSTHSELRNCGNVRTAALVGLNGSIDWLCDQWQQPDEGIWETRGGCRQHE